MPIFESFWKRQKKKRGEMPDVYQYEEIPEPLRVQIVQIMLEMIGDHEQFQQYHGPDEIVSESYGYIVKMLRKDFGVFTLPGYEGSRKDEQLVELAEFILKEENPEKLMSAVELICRFIERVESNSDYRNVQDAEEKSKDAIQEINLRFKEHGVGYDYDGEIIRIDDEFIHVEAVKPALSLLRKKEFAGAEQEFLSAHAHYRKGNYKEALNDALKAFESTMKNIYEKRKWVYDKNDTSSKLIKVAFDNSLVPDFWQAHFNAIRSTLESGIPTARNKLGGHGQGPTPTTVPEHLAAYVLHLTASAIVFLIKSEEAL